MTKLDSNDLKFLKEVNDYIDQQAPADCDDCTNVPNGDSLAIIIRKLEDIV